MVNRLIKFSYFFIFIVLTLSFVLALSSSNSIGDDWNLAGRYNNRTGFTASVAPSRIGNTNVTTFFQAVGNPIIFNESVYSNSFSGLTLFQLNQSNISQMLSNFTTTSILQPPVAAGGFIYVKNSTNDLLQLNATNLSQVIATFTNFTDGFSHLRITSPVIDNGLLYITTITNLGSPDVSYIYELNATNISQPIAVSIALIENTPISAPAIDNGFIYFGQHFQVFKINISNLSQIVSQTPNFDDGDLMFTTPTIANGLLYGKDQNGKLRQYSVNDLTTNLSQINTGDTQSNPVSVGNGFVYTARLNGYLQLNESNINQVIANLSGSLSAGSSTIAVNSQSAFLKMTGNLLQVNATNITQIVGTHIGASSSPIISNGFIFFASDLGTQSMVKAGFSPQDLTPPLVTIINPLNITYTPASFPLFFNVSLDENATNVRYTLNNGITNVTMNPIYDTFNWSGSNASLPSGSYTFRVFANDSFGNINSTQFVIFTVDAHAPQVTFISPTNSTFTNPNVPVELTTNELSFCQFSVDLGNKFALSTLDNLTFTGFAFPQGNGTHNIVAFCNNSIGNENHTVNVTFSLAVSSDPTLTSDSNSNDWRMNNRFNNNTGFGSSFGGTLDPSNLTIFSPISFASGSQSLVINGSLYYMDVVANQFVQANSSDPSQVLSNYSAVIFGSMVLSQQYFYASGFDPITFAQTFHQLNISNLSQEISQFAGGCTSPLVYKGNLYSSCNDNFKKLQGNFIGQTLDSTPAIYFDSGAATAIANDNLYAFVNDNQLVQIDTNNLSNQIAAFGGFDPLISNVDIFVSTPPTVSNGFVYVGSSPFGLKQTTEVYQLDANNITNIVSEFNITANTGLFTSIIAQGNGFVYVVDAQEGILYQLDENNISNVIATFTGDLSINSNPIINDNSLFLGDGSTFYQLNASDVSQVISQYTNSSDSFGSASIALGNVYVIGQSTGNIYMFSASAAPPLPPPTPSKCDAATQTGILLIEIFSCLAVGLYALYYTRFRNRPEDKPVTVTEIILIFLGIVIGLAFIPSIFQNLAFC